MRKSIFTPLILLLVLATAMVSCKKDENDNAGDFGTITLSGTLKEGEASGAKLVIPFTGAPEEGLKELSLSYGFTDGFGLSLDVATTEVSFNPDRSGKIEIPVSGTPAKSGPLSIELTISADRMNPSTQTVSATVEAVSPI